jgi:hypothetical protein
VDPATVPIPTELPIDKLEAFMIAVVTEDAKRFVVLRALLINTLPRT